MRVRVALVCLGVATSVGCTWVQLSAGGEQVQLASSKFVENCKQVGKSRANTKPTLLGTARSDATVREELRSLARNDAVAMGGTHVSPLDEATDGSQTFGIYVCSGAPAPASP